MQTMNVFHEPSAITYCDQHFHVVDELGHCPACEAPATDPPTPSPWVDFHAVKRWWQRVNPAVEQADAIASVRRIVMEGRRVSWPAAVAGCSYFSHGDWPGVVVVVRAETNCALTILTIIDEAA
jgi:hypothetical protein